MTWISVSASAPPIGVTIIFYDAVGDSVEIGGSRPDGYFQTRDRRVPLEHVTHWMVMTRPVVSDEVRARLTRAKP